MINSEINNNPISIKKKVLVLLIVIGVVLLSLEVAGICDEFIRPTIEKFYSNNLIIMPIIHHLAILIVAIVAILITKRYIKSNFGFTIGNKKIGIKHCVITSIIFLFFMLIIYGLGFIIRGSISTNNQLIKKQAIENIIYMAIIPGITEEIMCRSFVMTILYTTFKGEFKYEGKYKDITYSYKLSYAVVISSIIFALMHTGIVLYPFSIHFSAQIVIAFICGLIFGYTFEKTKSIYYPIIMHCAIDFISALIVSIFTVFL